MRGWGVGVGQCVRKCRRFHAFVPLGLRPPGSPGRAPFGGGTFGFCVLFRTRLSSLRWLPLLALSRFLVAGPRLTRGAGSCTCTPRLHRPGVGGPAFWSAGSPAVFVCSGTAGPIRSVRWFALGERWLWVRWVGSWVSCGWFRRCSLRRLAGLIRSVRRGCLCLRLPFPSLRVRWCPSSSRALNRVRCCGPRRSGAAVRVSTCAA